MPAFLKWLNYNAQQTPCFRSPLYKLARWMVSVGSLFALILSTRIFAISCLSLSLTMALHTPQTCNLEFECCSQFRAMTKKVLCQWRPESEIGMLGSVKICFSSSSALSRQERVNVKTIANWRTFTTRFWTLMKAHATMIIQVACMGVWNTLPLSLSLSLSSALADYWPRERNSEKDHPTTTEREREREIWFFNVRPSSHCEAKVLLWREIA